MIKCVIPCSISGRRLKEAERSLSSFTEQAGCYGFNASLSCSVTKAGKKSISAITLLVDDEMIRAAKGAKRGPKEKATNISVEEMAALKKEGVPPRDIADIAGIGVATYFRRMAAYKARTASGEKSQRGE